MSLRNLAVVFALTTVTAGCGAADDAEPQAPETATAVATSTPTRDSHAQQHPDDVDRVTVEGRDLLDGWGGDTVTVTVPR